MKPVDDFGREITRLPSLGADRSVICEDRVEVVAEPGYGRVLRSLVSVRKGDVLFHEKPLVVSQVTPTKEEEVDLLQLSDASGLNLINDFVFIKSFCMSDGETQLKVLDCYHPSPLEAQASELLSRIVSVAEVSKKYDWTSAIPLDTLREVVLVKACNAHGFYSSDSSAAALYTFGSKMRHSCCPNIIYTSQRSEGFGSFVARRDIAAGEELFITYIDNCRSVPMRNKDLRDNYLFSCDCRLCRDETDTFRGLPCSVRECGGSVYRTQSNGIWTCDACKNTFTDASTVISPEDEDEFVKDATELMQSFKVNISGMLRDILTVSHFRVGENHAITRMLQREYISRFLLERSVTNVVALDELIRTTDSILRWTKDDPSFFDSLLVEIGCAVARAGDFDKAIRYLTIVKEDMELLFGIDNRTAEPLVLVTAALEACYRGDAESVPNLF